MACPGKSGITDLVYTAMKECPGRKGRFMTSATTERIDVSVTSPDLEDTGDKKCFIIWIFFLSYSCIKIPMTLSNKITENINILIVFLHK